MVDQEEFQTWGPWLLHRLKYIWKIKDIDEHHVIRIAQKYNISLILAKLLILRKIKENEIENFLNPNFHNNIPNPFELKDMKKSVDRTFFAVSKKQKIGIIADYDVDGATSAAIIFNFFSLINYKVTIKIPDRLSEGFGPNLEAVQN